MYQMMRFSLAVEAASLALQATNALPPDANLHFVQASIIKGVEEQGGFLGLVKPMMNLADYASLQAHPYGDSSSAVLSRSLAALEYVAPGTINVLEARNAGLSDKIGFKPGKFQRFADFVTAGGGKSPLAMDVKSFSSFPELGGDPLLKPHQIRDIEGLRPQGIFSDTRIPVSLEAPANGLANFDFTTSRLITAYFGAPAPDGITNLPPDFSESPFGGRMCVGCQEAMPKVDGGAAKLPMFGSTASLTEVGGQNPPQSKRMSGPSIVETAQGDEYRDDYGGAAKEAAKDLLCSGLCDIGSVLYIVRESKKSAEKATEMAIDAFGPKSDWNEAQKKITAEGKELLKTATDTYENLPKCAFDKCRTKVDELLNGKPSVPTTPPKTEEPKSPTTEGPKIPPKAEEPKTPPKTKNASNDGLTVDPTTVPPESDCAVDQNNGRPFCGAALPADSSRQASSYFYRGSGGHFQGDLTGFKAVFVDDRAKSGQICVDASCAPVKPDDIPVDCPQGGCLPPAVPSPGVLPPSFPPSPVQ
ncbi:hypothetical protein [Rhizobium indigoferae]|uniref:Uncharacterized protein n=1 Tax=Rhizobium indigoferae TaxID=158891 RepID=A0ABZ0ZKY0_9HYPH|nr:hypothetical protein [Rhizobium indigoferae]NNU57600.1 hypothetical protein [Rhizobium indigoferae]WQN39520.1 hypothetical protein U5G49_004724 [Rhizobium indigoferae]